MEFDFTDLEFAHHGDAPLLLRLYRPRGPGPFPAVVDVHGGAWTNGTREKNVAIHKHLAASGVVVAALDFRMPPAAMYPASVVDVGLGLRWLKQNAQRFDVHPDLIGALGTSSGGHQMLVVALRPRAPWFAALFPDLTPADLTLRFAIAAWPVADPLTRYRMAKQRGVQRLIDAHHAYWPSEALMEEGNPQRIVERGEAQQLPPLLIVQGTDDDNLPPNMADNFAAAYRRAGGAVELEKFAGEPHTFISKDPSSAATARALALMSEFIARQCAAAGLIVVAH